MPGLVPGIRDLKRERRGWPGQARPWRKTADSGRTSAPASRARSCISPAVHAWQTGGRPWFGRRTRFRRSV